MEPLFELGQMVATPGAIRALGIYEVNPLRLLARHQSGDWGDLSDADKRANQRALKDGGRIFSAYLFGRNRDFKIWVITEAEHEGKRTSTCILLPDEY